MRSLQFSTIISDMFSEFDLFQDKNWIIGGKYLLSRKLNEASFTSRQNNLSGETKRRPDNVFILKNPQESMYRIYILNVFSIDQSAIFCSHKNDNQVFTGPNLWKFITFLFFNTTFNEHLKSFMQNKQVDLVNDKYLSDQSN